MYGQVYSLLYQQYSMKRSSQTPFIDLVGQTETIDQFYVGSFLEFAWAEKNGKYQKETQIYEGMMNKYFTHPQNQDTKILYMNSLLQRKYYGQLSHRNNRLLKVRFYINDNIQIVHQREQVVDDDTMRNPYYYINYQASCRCDLCRIPIRIDVYLTELIFHNEYIDILEDFNAYDLLEKNERKLKNAILNKIRSKQYDQNQLRQLNQQVNQHRYTEGCYKVTKKSIENKVLSEGNYRYIVRVFLELLKIKIKVPILINSYSKRKYVTKLDYQQMDKILSTKRIYIYVRDQQAADYYKKLDNYPQIQKYLVFYNGKIPESTIDLEFEQTQPIPQTNSTPEIEVFDKPDCQVEKVRQKSHNLSLAINQENQFYKIHDRVLDTQIPLLYYQSKALTWMKYKEGRLSFDHLFEKEFNRDKYNYERELNPFCGMYELPNNVVIYYNDLTAKFSKYPTLSDKVKGGILADEMGLGKTITALSLIVDDVRRQNKYEGKIAQNLIVVPLNVISHWEAEIERYSSKKLHVYVYHDNKDKYEQQLDKYDIVITTYSTMGCQFKKYSKSTNKQNSNYIYNYAWRRVILDEAHNIKNRTTLMAKGACELKALYRWCMTGTPLQNNNSQLYSLLKFLKFDLFSEWHWWKTYINNAESMEERFNLIHEIMRPILLRRTKELVLKLPEKKPITINAPFNEMERTIYMRLKTISKDIIKKNLESGYRDAKRYHLILTILLRLRQLCCHPALIFKNIKKSEFDTIYSTAQIHKILNLESIKFERELIQRYRKGDSVTCPNCRLEGAEILLTECRHLFCTQCPFLKDENQEFICPKCNKEIDRLKNQMVSIEKEEIPQLDTDMSSSKLDRIVNLIQEIVSRKQKCLVFSQWLTMLSLVQRQCTMRNIQFCRIDGSVSQEQRKEQIRIFNQNDQSKIFLISLGSGSTGLNLTVANNVIICDPWWNPAIEDQASDRVHRIGQNKPVNVYRVIMDDTVEEDIMKMHIRKREQLHFTLMKGKQDKMQDEMMEIILR